VKEALLAIAALLAAPALALADPITLEDAIARAQQLDQQVQLQALSSEAAEARVLADPRAGSPSLRLRVSDLDTRTALQPTPRDPEYTARLRMPLPRPWELAAAARQGAATVAREDAELDALKDDVRLAVTERARALPLLRQAVATATTIVELRTEHVELVARRRTEGLATALDWLESEERRRDADDRRAAQRAELHAVEAELRALLQWPLDEPLEVLVGDPDARAAAPIPALDALMRPTSELAAGREATAEVARAEARLQRKRLDALPWIDWLQGGATFQDDAPVSFDVGLAIDVPIYLWSPARTRAAAQEVESARLELSALERANTDLLDRRRRAAVAAQERWRVEQAHRDAVTTEAQRLVELAEPILQLELQARIARAELRVLLALTDLSKRLDRLEAAR